MASTSASGAAYESWLEIIEGAAPLLLIAPHGGRAGSAARSTLHPKVNDLETAAITRDLAHRLGATALINAAMDRNDLDCNRLSQLAARAPWMLDLIAARAAKIVERHSHATVLLIHGWNVIEPRIDLGLGLREHRGQLRPPAGAHVSASDAFIKGPVAALAARLGSTGIIPSFGLRYPGGASQNLLQAFTQRHRTSALAALRRLAELAGGGAVNAVQLEMSVAVRMPGDLRNRGLDAIARFALATGQNPAFFPARSQRPDVIVVREGPGTRTPRKAAAATAAAQPYRVGVEFYDRASRIGAMASFDFGSNAAGARIMVMFDGCRAALFTGEGRSERQNGQVRLGPLALTLDPGGGRLNFRGPAVIVNDGAAYLSVENALANGSLDSAMELTAAIELGGDSAPGVIEAVFSHAQRNGDAAPLSAQGEGIALYGRLRGTIVVGGSRRPLDAVARVGTSFTGLGARKFASRRMLWAYFPDGAAPAAIEAHALNFADGTHARAARLLEAGRWLECACGPIELDTARPGGPPGPIAAAFSIIQNPAMPLLGSAENFMTLSRPGPDHTRIHSTLGFATYRSGSAIGAGMFEYSRVVGEAPAAREDNGEDNE